MTRDELRHQLLDIMLQLPSMKGESHEAAYRLVLKVMVGALAVNKEVELAELVGVWGEKQTQYKSNKT